MNKFSMIIGVSKMLVFEITGCNDSHLRFPRIPLRHDLKKIPKPPSSSTGAGALFFFFFFFGKPSQITTQGQLWVTNPF